jgi:GTPase SAR1 family protein
MVQLTVARTAEGASIATTAEPARIDLSLISHTNVGKTTLARTLLRRDIGEVGDRPHVTDVAESDVLIRSVRGDSLVLWDTPGFGDSGRLLKRLRQADHPVAWFLGQVWDRFADRPFWCSQQAMRTMREASDVVLYVANASERPSAAGYIDIEMQILDWLAKPVVLLLNQLGPPGTAAHTATEVQQWEAHVAQHSCVKLVLPFDAFARCWVQEGTLLDNIRRVLPEAKAAAFERIQEAWKQRNLDVFQLSMQVLARQLAALAVDIERIVEPPGKARAWLGAAAQVLSGTGPRNTPEVERAQAALASRLDRQVRAATEELVRLHGLTGKATEEVLQRLGHEFLVRRAADADTASVLGGLVSGALGGLAADLAAGGLTFGAGAVIGGVLGAFGARGLAKAYNLARSADMGTVRWSPEFLSRRLAAALMRYLAVAHFGRGRGDFVAGLAPAHWLQAVEEILSERRTQIESAWVLSRTDTLEGSAAALLPIVSAAGKSVLVHLYPDSAPIWAQAGARTDGGAE